MTDNGSAIRGGGLVFGCFENLIFRGKYLDKCPNKGRPAAVLDQKASPPEVETTLGDNRLFFLCLPVGIHRFVLELNESLTSFNPSAVSTKGPLEGKNCYQEPP